MNQRTLKQKMNKNLEKVGLCLLLLAFGLIRNVLFKTQSLPIWSFCPRWISLFQSFTGLWRRRKEMRAGTAARGWRGVRRFQSFLYKFTQSSCKSRRGRERVPSSLRPSLPVPPYFFLVLWLHQALHYLNAWNRLTLNTSLIFGIVFNKSHKFLYDFLVTEFIIAQLFISQFYL